MWDFGLFGFRIYPKLAALMGAMPDLISCGAGGYKATLTWSKLHWRLCPAGFARVYIGHSSVIAFAVIGLVAMLGLPFHITLDFSFHSFQYFPTSMFCPISGYKFDTIPWSHLNNGVVIFLSLFVNI